jgi:HPt (histidine-containing phosphotransfer) domain-containing protein
MTKIVIKIDPDLADIVPSYLANRHKEIPVLWEAIRNHDFTTLATLGHRIKGSAGSYGFDHLGQIGSGIEIAATEKNISKLQILIRDLEVYINNLELVYE